MRNLLLKVSKPPIGVAQGLLHATMDPLTGIKTPKLRGSSTDDESAYTGRDRGLWKLLADKLNVNLLTMWPVAHRIDLVMQQLVIIVPELRMWKSNLKSVPTYLCCSAKRTKELNCVQENCKAFPAYHEVRWNR